MLFAFWVLNVHALLKLKFEKIANWAAIKLETARGRLVFLTNASYKPAFITNPNPPTTKNFPNFPKINSLILEITTYSTTSSMYPKGAILELPKVLSLKGNGTSPILNPSLTALCKKEIWN